MSQSSPTTNSNALVFEMQVLNNLRKLTPEQRTELISTVEKEEQQEKEALKNNPNLYTERKLEIILNELKTIKNDMYSIKKSIHKNDNNLICIDTQPLICGDDCSMYETLEDLFSWDWETILQWGFFILIFISILLTPSQKLNRPIPFCI